MWLFMQSCYILSVITLLMLLTAFIQSFLHFFIFKANHVTFMILTSIVYCLTETLVIFFFVGTGVSIKEYSRDQKLDAGYQQQSLKVKMKVYPPLLFNILLMVVLFVLAGAVDTQKISRFSYQIFYVICLLHFVYSKKIQHESFRENTDIILRMSGIT